MTGATQPHSTSTAPLHALGLAVGLGLLGDALFKNAPFPGINVILWIVALAAAARAIARATPDAPPGKARWILIAAGFASCLAIRDAETLKALDTLAILLALGLACLPWAATDQQRARLRDIGIALFNTFAMVCAGPILLASATDWTVLRAGRSRRAGPVLMGILLAIPIVIVFGSLFASADPSFAALGSSLFDGDLGPAIAHAFVIAGFAWVAAGLLRAWLWKPALSGLRSPVASLRIPSLGPIQIGIAVGAMLAVFLVFVAIQSRYLFGGEAMVRSLAGLSYAEYARQGFFEMVAATALVVPVLYGADALMPKGNPRAVQSLRALGSVQLLLTLCVCASAIGRMALYVGAYGLTQDRILASAILAWLAATIVIFASTVLRGRPERFCYGAIAAGFITLGALNAVNPDALIARVAIARAAEGRDVDGAHLARLGADATPVLLAGLDRLPVTARCPVWNGLQQRYAPAEPSDWRSWNLGRSRALAAARLVGNKAECAATPGPVPE